MTKIQTIGSIIVSLNELGTSESALLDAYDSLASLTEMGSSESKLLAEVAYLLAIHYQRLNSPTQARRYRDESIALYQGLAVDSLDSAAPILSKYLPDVMHEGVVARLFA